MKSLAISVFILFLFSGCAWVKITPGGARISVASNTAEVSNCRKIGETTVFLRDKVGFYRRNPDKVAEELSILGRNSAADMGGDTIFPLSAVEQGERTFSVYHCGSN